MATQQQQSRILNRPVAPAKSPQGIDLELTKAIVSLRLRHDEAALAQLRQAGAVTVEGHKAGMAWTGETPVLQAGVRAAMEATIRAHNMTCAYPSIVTVHGEVLHSEQYHHRLQPGDLLLADVGAETVMGWASDVTRTLAGFWQVFPDERGIFTIWCWRRTMLALRRCVPVWSIKIFTCSLAK